MAAVGEAGEDRFRPHFLAIEGDDMVDTWQLAAWERNRPLGPGRGGRVLKLSQVIGRSCDPQRADANQSGQCQDATPKLNCPRRLEPDDDLVFTFELAMPEDVQVDCLLVCIEYGSEVILKKTKALFEVEVRSMLFVLCGSLSHCSIVP